MAQAEEQVECRACKGQAYFDGRNTCKVCNVPEPAEPDLRVEFFNRHHKDGECNYPSCSCPFDKGPDDKCFKRTSR